MKEYWNKLPSPAQKVIIAIIILIGIKMSLHLFLPELNWTWRNLFNYGVVEEAPLSEADIFELNRSNYCWDLKAACEGGCVPNPVHQRGLNTSLEDYCASRTAQGE